MYRGGCRVAIASKLEKTVSRRVVDQRWKMPVVEVVSA
jgi:hypothetical protein